MEPQIAASVAPAVVHEVLRSPGQPLDGATRAYMEPRFGQDFSSVRLHTGARATASAAALGASAYTVGQSIIFGRDQFDPTSETGRRLVAHELAHTVQQRGGVDASPTAPPSPEQETGRADQTLNRKAVPALTPVGIGVACQRLPGVPHSTRVVDGQIFLVRQQLKMPVLPPQLRWQLVTRLQALVAERDRLLRGGAESVGPVSEPTESLPTPASLRDTSSFAVLYEGTAEERWNKWKADVGEARDTDERMSKVGHIYYYLTPEERDHFFEADYSARALHERYVKYYAKNELDDGLHFYQGTRDDPLVTGYAGGEYPLTARAGEFRSAVEEAHVRDVQDKIEGVATAGLFATVGRVVGAITGYLTDRDVLASSEIGAMVLGAGDVVLPGQAAKKARANARETGVPARIESSGAWSTARASSSVQAAIAEQVRMGFLDPALAAPEASVATASSQTERSQATAIRAQTAEMTAYDARLDRHEIGLLAPAGSNITGPDYVTAVRLPNGDFEIVVGDTKSRVSNTSAFGRVSIALPATWRTAVDDAVARLGLANPNDQRAIQDAWAQDRFRIARDTVDYSLQGQGDLRLDN